MILIVVWSSKEIENWNCEQMRLTKTMTFKALQRIYQELMNE